MELDYLRKGERITAAHYREVTRAAKAMMGTGRGHSDGDGMISVPARNYPNQIQVLTEVDIPKHSVFQLSIDTVTEDITVFNAQLVDNSTNKILVTNDVESIVAGTPSWATIIPFDRNIKVKVDTANIPDVLEDCGVADDETTVASGQTGLVCLSTPDDDDMIEVIAKASASSGTEVCTFRITDIVRGRGLNCHCVEAEVINISCGAAGIATGDTINVWDGLFCQFLFPMEVLTTLKGIAVKMKNIDDRLVEDGYEQLGACRWEAIKLCCAEETVI